MLLAEVGGEVLNVHQLGVLLHVLLVAFHQVADQRLVQTCRGRGATPVSWRRCGTGVQGRGGN